MRPVRAVAWQHPVSPRPRPVARGPAPTSASTPRLLGPLALLACVGLVAYNFQLLLALLGRETFHGDARTVGYLLGALGAGSVIGGLALAGVLRATVQRIIGCGAAVGGLVPGHRCRAHAGDRFRPRIRARGGQRYLQIAREYLVAADGGTRDARPGDVAPGRLHRRHDADRRPADGLDRRAVRHAGPPSSSPACCTALAAGARLPRTCAAPPTRTSSTKLSRRGHHSSLSRAR